ncbi:MAG: hypothetical protein IGS50_20615 [Synechococcales cyanobacterium C42_A2020_086]|jgi:hypothetical protein|nr:hypothetical protein [Synechococcales cyanobacterium M58_A2018_015]MBF2076144.1 hypothetical protein [Synechococcales cyanobacterium C42_A2020_086]
MTTHFITLELELQETPTRLQQEILVALCQWGEPLRWAITGVAAGKVRVEAVVTTEGEILLPGVPTAVI